jgi:hypothetical protein
MEIYNEVINDLLDKNSTNLKIREDTNSPIGAYVQGLKAYKLIDFDHFLDILNKGEKNRQYGKTEMNQKYADVYSSRSHTLLRIVNYCLTTDGAEQA